MDSILPRTTLAADIESPVKRASSLTYGAEVNEDSNASTKTRSLRRTFKRRNNNENGEKKIFWTRENLQLAACYWSLASAGWNDASVGPLIPYMERYYNIGYTTVATMFVGSCGGYIVAGLLNGRLTYRFGMGRLITFGACLQMLGYAVFIGAPPFVLFPITYVVIGFGVAGQDAGANAYVAGLDNASIKLGYLHGAYGLGGLLAPLVATLFVQRGLKFSLFFAVSLGMAAVNVVVLFFTFCWKQQHNHTQVAEVAIAETPAIPMTPMKTDEGDQHSGNGRQGHDSVPIAEEITASAEGAPALVDQMHNANARDKAILTNRVVWLTCFFLLAYVGAEVSLGGWCVSFLIQTRDGDASVGYVASGFWGGITLGRVVLPRFNLWVGEHRVIFLYSALAIGLEISIWVAPSMIGNAVAFSLIGFLLGPFFPVAISVLTKVLPKHLHADESGGLQCGVGLVASIGSAGAAIFPFTTGALAGKYGTWVLQPMIISLLGVMVILWLLVPPPSRHSD